MENYHLGMDESNNMTGFQKLMLVVIVMGTMFFIQKSMLG